MLGSGPSFAFIEISNSASEVVFVLHKDHMLMVVSPILESLLLFTSEGEILYEYEADNKQNNTEIMI